MKLRLLALLILSTAATVWSADPPPVAPADKPPIIQLPPEPITDVAKFDATVMKARDVPYHVSLVKAPEAWAKNPLARGKGIKIAIVDTGIQADHPGFDGMVKGSYNAITKKEGFAAGADDNNHGTHCAGIVHAILPDAELYACKGMDARGAGSVADLAHGIDYAASVFKVDVISCSFGGSQADSYLQPAIQRANALGCIVVCAAGNDGGGPGKDTEGYPGRYPEAISVAACDSARQLASFSSWGPNVYTADPGVDVWSLLPGTKEGKMSGTSMACPVEAGKVGSWIASNGVAKTGGRKEKYLLASKGAMPFKERTNARGYGLYELDKITGEAKAPPGPGNPPVPGTPTEVSLDFNDLTPEAKARLTGQGVKGFKLAVQVGGFVPQPSSQPIPVMELKPPGEPNAKPPAIGVQSVPPAATYNGFSPAPQFGPAPPVYQQMPQQGCPGGVCQPGQPQQQAAPVFFPRLRGWR